MSPPFGETFKSKASLIFESKSLRFAHGPPKIQPSTSLKGNRSISLPRVLLAKPRSPLSRGYSASNIQNGYEQDDSRPSKGSSEGKKTAKQDSLTGNANRVSTARSTGHSALNKPEPQTGRLARSASFLRLSTFLKQAASPSAPPEAKNFSSGSFPTRHAALRERGLRPKLSLSALEAELDRHIPPSYEHRSSDDGTTLSPAGQIKAQWEAKNKLEEERQGRVHTPVSQGPPVPPGLESVREVGSETSSSSTHGILEDEDMAIIGSLYPEALLPLPDSPSPSIHDPCLDSTIHDATLFAHDPQSKPNTIVSFRLHTESNKLPAPQISEVAASQRETPSSSPEARIPTPTPPHPIIEIRDVQCKPWVEETHKLPRLSSRLSMASLRRTVVGTISRNKTTTFDEYNSHSSDAGMLLQTSPSLHVRCPTPIPSSDTSRFGPSPSFRAAIRPRMHTQGTILLGVAEIEDEETRRMTELAFM